MFKLLEIHSSVIPKSKDQTKNSKQGHLLLCSHKFFLNPYLIQYSNPPIYRASGGKQKCTVNQGHGKSGLS